MNVHTVLKYWENDGFTLVGVYASLEDAERAMRPWWQDCDEVLCVAHRLGQEVTGQMVDHGTILWSRV